MALKTSCELSPNMYNSRGTTLLEVTSRYHEFTKCSQLRTPVKTLGYNAFWERVIPLLAIQSPYVLQKKSGFLCLRGYEPNRVVNGGDEAKNNSLGNSLVCVRSGASANNTCIRVVVPFEAKYV